MRARFPPDTWPTLSDSLRPEGLTEDDLLSVAHFGQHAAAHFQFSQLIFLAPRILGALAKGHFKRLTINLLIALCNTAVAAANGQQLTGPQV